MLTSVKRKLGKDLNSEGVRIFSPVLTKSFYDLGDSLTNKMYIKLNSNKPPFIVISRFIKSSLYTERKTIC